MNSKLPSFNQSALIAVLTLMMFGIQNAKGELILFKKSLKEKIYSTGNNSQLTNPPVETIGTIEVGADEEVNKVKLLHQIE